MNSFLYSYIYGNKKAKMNFLNREAEGKRLAERINKGLKVKPFHVLILDGYILPHLEGEKAKHQFVLLKDLAQDTI